MPKPRRTMSAIVSAFVLLTACGGSKTPEAPRATAPRVSTTTSSSIAAPTATSPASPGTGGTIGGPTASGGWTVDTTGCADPARADQPIDGTVTIGAAMPLSGGPAAAFGPIKDGFEAYLAYASDHGLLPGYTLTADIRDDQYDPTQSPGVVDGLITDGVDLFAGIIGTPNNLAVRDSLNKACIPQLEALTGSPAWGDVAKYPWTTGALVPYDVEAAIYATKINELKPGATVALYYDDNEFGNTYIDSFKAKAGELGLQIVDEQKVDSDFSDPPVAQVASIAGKLPDAIVSVPVGLQCPAFLAELASAKTKAAGWAPLVFMTNTCSSRLFFGLAGDAADGVYTSNNLVDSNDPKNANEPGVKTFLDAVAAAQLTGDPGVSQAGWSAGETTVAILNAALKSGALTRKSIIEAARTLTFTPSLARANVQYKMNGAEDPFAFQTLQVLQWSTASQTFSDVGEAITTFES